MVLRDPYTEVGIELWSDKYLKLCIIWPQVCNFERGETEDPTSVSLGLVMSLDLGRDWSSLADEHMQQVWSYCLFPLNSRYKCVYLQGIIPEATNKIGEDVKIEVERKGEGSRKHHSSDIFKDLKLWWGPVRTFRLPCHNLSICLLAADATLTRPPISDHVPANFPCVSGSACHLVKTCHPYLPL